MKHTINKYYFSDQFHKIRPNDFSYEGLYALYEYLTDLELETGIEFEFDPIAFSCDYSEYSSALEACDDYGIPAITEEQAENNIMNQTTLIRFDSGIIIQNW